jgi:hypothetical protein
MPKRTSNVCCSSRWVATSRWPPPATAGGGCQVLQCRAVPYVYHVHNSRGFPTHTAGLGDGVLSGSSPLHGPGFPLLFKHWTRLANVVEAALLAAVDVELCDVPTHGWDTSMTQMLLALLEKRFIRTSGIHFLYRLISVADTINKK